MQDIDKIIQEKAEKFRAKYHFKGKQEKCCGTCMHWKSFHLFGGEYSCWHPENTVVDEDTGEERNGALSDQHDSDDVCDVWEDRRGK